MDVITMSRFDLNKQTERELLNNYIQTFNIKDDVETYYNNRMLCSVLYGHNIVYTSDFTEYLPIVFDEKVSTFTYNNSNGRTYISHYGKEIGVVFYATYSELLEKLK